MKLKDILLKKAEKQELGHFYIVESGASEAMATKSLMQFAHEFIRDYYQKIEGHKQSLTHLMDHPDVYVLGNVDQDEDNENKFFTVADAEAFSRFFEFKPVQGKRKFAVITEGHRINSNVANKWLKLLEEPYGMSTILLLNPRGGKLLDTIHSRAIHLRLPADTHQYQGQEWLEFISSAKSLSLSQFLDEYMKGEKELSFWMEELIQWESEQTDQTEGKAALEKWIKSFQEMEIFHQPTATKWTMFYSHLQNHVFPRVRLAT